MLSMISLNLRFGLAKDGSDSWSFRENLYPGLLKAYPVDFFCFQEANDFQIEFLQALLPGYCYIGQRKDAPAFWQSNVIFFKTEWNCVHSEHFYLSHTPEIPSRFRNSKWPRQCTLGWFRSGDRHLICLNTHFDFETDVQIKSAALILEKLRAYSAEEPVILAGDFNADPDSACYRMFTREETGHGPHRLIPFRNAFAPHFPGTYHGFTGHSNGSHIDWILYKGPLEVVEADVIRDNLDGRFPSDHFPLKAIFHLYADNG